MAYTTIDDPSAYFQTAIYTGTGSSQTVTNDGNSDLKPDWIWIKCRSNARDHVLLDSTRGGTKALTSNTNGAEATDGAITAFNTDGFTHSGQNAYGGSSETHVAWQWKANGGTTSSNSDGDITATVQANTTAGFSIVTYTGNGNASAQTVGHGLGAECRVVIAKTRSLNDESWRVFHESVSQSGGGNLFLNGTSALDTSDPARITSTNTTTFTLDGYHSTYDALNENSQTYLAYCFAEKKGYSKFGSYTGNGNADGTFLYLGFRPKFIIIKRTDTTGSWFLIDSVRDINTLGAANTKGSAEAQHQQLFADASDAEATYNSSAGDFLSNGYKLKGTNASTNASGGTFIYLAFAEHPFVSSKGVPVTAR